MKIDPVKRAEYREKYNKPNLLVFGIIALILILVVGPGFLYGLEKGDELDYVGLCNKTNIICGSDPDSG